MVGKQKLLQVIFAIITINTVLFGSVATTSEEQIFEIPNHSQVEEIPRSKSIRQNKGETVGEQKTFWVLDYITSQYEEVTAELLSVGQYCYIYVDLTTINSIGETEATEKSNFFSSEFDSVMYPINLELVGHPDGYLGDVDGDPKITVLVSPESYGGVYLFKDENPLTPYSNGREMVYIHSSKGELSGINTIIHELNHLIWFNHEQDESIFVLEGTAEYSRYKADYLNNLSHILAYEAADYNLTYSTNYFRVHPERSLLFWDYSDVSLNRASYGRSYMFMLYLSERFGEELLTDLVIIAEDGPEGIETALKNRGYNYTFNEVYMDWITACSIDLEEYGDGRYGYHTAEFKISAFSTITSIPFHSSKYRYNSYGFKVNKLITPPNEFTLKITNPIPHVLGLSVVINDENGWNVTQIILDENEDELIQYFSGSEINYAYIIISMISRDTPYAANFNYPGLTAPYSELEFSILEGHVIFETTGNSEIRFLFVGFCLVFSLYALKQIRRYRKLKTHNYA